MLAMSVLFTALFSAASIGPSKTGYPVSRASQQSDEMKRATPGGYGGKPPGVAIIGVPTGARNAGSGALTGDQSTDMNGTRPTPLVCQDLRRPNLGASFLPHAYRRGGPLA
jgi:hypothetical protein